MHAKKKTRARNRPRNKCNQTNELKSEPGAAAANPALEPIQSEPARAEPDASVINLIQRLLRKKLLAKANNSAPSNPSIVQAKAPSPLRKHSPLGSKDDEVNDLLKCIGSNLQKGSTEAARGALLSQLGEMFSTAPLTGAESSDEEAEYVEYIYRPRQYFMTSLCNHCKLDLCGRQAIPCKGCAMVYYCTVLHMRDDQEHRQLCCGLRQVVERQGHDIFHKCGDFSAEQFRSYRIVCIRQVEQAINRSLTPTEQEVLLFPFICGHAKCREHKFKKLTACAQCGEVAFCKGKQDHLSVGHAEWCSAYKLFKAFVMFQAKFGRVEPPLPDKVLREKPSSCSNTKQILKKLNFNVVDGCEFAALTQVSTGPLTAFFALKLCGLLEATQLTIHLIGAEMEFEVDVFQKWEIFLLHTLPALETLHIVFIGPELNPNNISFDQLSTIRCCRLCRKAQRTVQYHFENRLYHDYYLEPNFLKPDLVCFFNSGLYRATGYALEDTWPETIRATLSIKCPIVVTSYTKYEAPLDLSQFLNQSNRHLTVVLPPTTNPFRSEKPERNFISDDDSPFMFKNYQCFVVE
ncbi:PREDICTED: uncharacterized protein LOC108613753 [Drosophila arizonae]|uniref:Uncharacterized protein LOC108613753 n=1 Tax=Drosophila arizonae TaxID=7263 RepID=A0ABM1P6T3_DROAR|nr:PREDICTED: uncharacterized protein LOC108613753 [Drosophila arizonae]